MPWLLVTQSYVRIISLPHGVMFCDNPRCGERERSRVCALNISSENFKSCVTVMRLAQQQVGIMALAKENKNQTCI